MATSPKKRVGGIRHWLDDASDDSIIKDVINSWPFRRLAGISFLGAIDYISLGDSGLSTARRTRQQHSLHVAALANFVASNRGYSEEVRRHLVVAALLHDIGHAPLSHSVEPHFKSALGFGHHEMGLRIIDGEYRRCKPLARLLRNKCDLSLIIALIEGKAPTHLGGDLFSAKINIDTIDGIWRSCMSLAGSALGMDRIAVANAAFLAKGEHGQDTLDHFWRLKDFTYNQFITSEAGLLADWRSQTYFQKYHVPLDEADLIERESAWRKDHPMLFLSLKGGRAPLRSSEGKKVRSLPFVKRQYWVSNAQDNEDRYQVTKRDEVLSVIG
ncbi:MAG: HD domain-containing protein [Pseudomonadota bacterium]|nr:HD domain-containing protein [Pseudomonadota bacterium]